MIGPKTYTVKLGLGKEAVVDFETGEILGYNYTRDPLPGELQQDLESCILDENGCLNGDDVEGLKDDPDFIDVFLDDRYSGPYD